MVNTKNLPQIQGKSEKQIKFAEDLRKGLFEIASSQVEKFGETRAHHPSIKADKQAIDYLKEETDAEKIIDFCKTGYDELNKQKDREMRGIRKRW